MDKRTNWIAARIRLGWMFLIAGFLVISVGVFSEIRFSDLPYNFRILTGLGILLAGTGVGYLVRYRAALKNDEQSARRLVVEELDERTVLIRTRAGNKAYLVSAVMVYIGLMWTSFAAIGSLPALEEDTLWFFLAACVLIPFGVYAGSILIDQQRI